MLKIMIGLMLVFALAFGMQSIGPVMLPPPVLEGVGVVMRRAARGVKHARGLIPRTQWRIRGPNWSPGYQRPGTARRWVTADSLVLPSS